MCNGFQNNKDCKIYFRISGKRMYFGKNKKMFWELNRKMIKALGGLVNNVSLQGYKKKHLW